MDQVKYLLLVCLCAAGLFCLQRQCFCLALRLAHDQESTVIDIAPCNRTELSISSNDTVLLLSVSANLSLCQDAGDMKAFSISTESAEGSVTKADPLVFVAQNKSSVLHWTIPFTPHGSHSQFFSVERTMVFCDSNTNNTSDADSQSNTYMLIHVSTGSPSSVRFSVTVAPLPNFTLTWDEPRKTAVGAASPQVFYFDLNGTKEVGVKATSDDECECAIFSIQSITECPPSELYSTTRSLGMHQTITSSGYMTVDEDDVQDGQFYVVLVVGNSSKCHSKDFFRRSKNKNCNESTPYYTKEMSVSIVTYDSAIARNTLIPVAMVLAMFLAVLLLYAVFNSRCFWTPCCEWEWKQREGGGPLQRPGQGTYGSISTDETELEAGGSVREYRVIDTSKKEHSKLQSDYRVYKWNTLTVCIFYGLPAFQLVFAQQMVLKHSGDQDMCYYNFQCLREVKSLSSFNNIWSNIGYVMLGFLFLLFVVKRNCSTYLQFKDEERKEYLLSHGLPVFYGIYYALGIALMFEGVMSAIYHICPSGVNFQFDTAFMFIIAGLLIIKIMQNRHPDFNTHAFVAFLSFGVVIFFTLVGIYLDTELPYFVRVVLLVATLSVMGVFLFSFYHLYHGYSELKKFCTTICQNFTFKRLCSPRHKLRFFKVIVIFLVNVAVVISGLALKEIDLASLVLGLFVGNAGVFIGLYVLSKLVHREPWTILPFIFVVLIVVCWGAAFFFKAHSGYKSDSSTTPAESRAKNNGCKFLDFYSSHDIWHFLSGAGMFFTFMFVLTVDDGITHLSREDIKAF